jgi:hypothetical protein
MSLINDALKRANQTRKQQQSPGTPSGPVMHPQETPNRSSSLALILFVGILVMFLAGLGTLLLVRGIYTAKPTVVSTHPAEQPVTLPMAAKPIPAVIPQPQPVLQSTVVVTRPSKPIVNTSVVVTIPIRGAVAQGTVAANDAAATVAAKPEATVTAKPEKAVAVAAEETIGPSSLSLKLQGVYYRRTNPSAMINGHNAFVGDEVDGARVVMIERTSVVVEFKGQKQVLHLP